VGQAVVVDVTELRETEARLRQNEQRYRTLVEMSPDPILVHTDGEIVYANDAMVDLAGAGDREELVGSEITRYLSADEHADARETARAVQRGHATPTGYGRRVETLTGDTRYVETTSRPIAYEGDPAVLTIVNDVTDRHRYEEQLTQLHERARTMARAQSRASIADVAVHAAVDLLDVDAAIVYELDDGETLAPSCWSNSISEPPTSHTEESVLWECFVEGELRPIDDELAVCSDLSLRSGLVLPVGNHGVFVAGARDDVPLEGTRRQIGRLLVEDLDAAFDRADREAALRERDRRLQRQNEQLEQLARLNELIREINQALIRSTTGAEIKASVCEQFAATDPYTFAWIATPAPSTDAISPESWSGIDAEFVDRFESGSESTPLATLVETAAERRSVQIAQALLEDDDWEPHRRDILRHGYRAVAAIPVIRGTTLDSVLVVHAEASDAFQARERAVLEELGQTIGYALRNVERVDAITADERTELEVSIDDEALFTNRITTRLDATFEFVGAIQGSDENAIRVFCRLSGVPESTVSEVLSAFEDVLDVRPLSVDDTDGLYQLTLSTLPLVGTVRRLDARLLSLEADAGRTTATVVLPSGTDVRALIEELQSVYPGAELLARRSDARPVDTRETFRDRIVDRLTDKQLDALRTAHYGGFYQWPRATTSEELADTRDIAASTFQYHLRAAERKVVAAILELL
ncbi:MAG: bacterio-opsin activator domain-containing protein, partial [Haloferacaceae archaeon]